MEEISFEELRKIHLQEKHSSTLSLLCEDFFDIYLAYLEKFYSNLKKEFSMEQAKTYENSKMIFKEIVRLRSHKIILKAFKDARTGGVSSEGLTHQEKKLYLTMLKSFNDYENNLADFKQSLPIEEVAAVQNKVKIELLAEVPEFVSPSGKPIGPMLKGETKEVDEETANFLQETGMAKKV